MGGGAGGLDVYLAEDFETTQASDFTTGNSATFLGGGTLDGALSNETTSPIAGDRSIKYTASTSSTNDYWAGPVIDIDDKQKENFSGFTFYHTLDEAIDIETVIYDVTNAAKLNSTTDVVTLTSGATRFATTFYIPSSDRDWET